MNLWKNNLFFIGVLVGCLFFSGTPVVHGFIIGTSKSSLDNMEFLIKEIFKPQWVIGFRYGADCKTSEKQNSEALQKAITTSLRNWLEPIKELKPTRPIVDKFIYELQPDFNPINPGDTYNSNEPEDLTGWERVDLRGNL